MTAVSRGRKTTIQLKQQLVTYLAALVSEFDDTCTSKVN